MSGSKPARFIQQHWICCTGLVLCFAAAGCQLTPAPQLSACPLPAAEQVAEILQIVPLGTSRDDVATKLKDAGVLGGFNTNRSIFYCDLWARNDKLRWHINVALLFDDEGILYATQPDASGQMNPSPSTATKESS